MSDNDTPQPVKVNNFETVAAVLLFAACIAAMLYMFDTGMDKKHETMVMFLGFGAFLSAMKAL